jgi:hypothetical protein
MGFFVLSYIFIIKTKRLKWYYNEELNKTDISKEVRFIWLVMSLKQWKMSKKIKK